MPASNSIVAHIWFSSEAYEKAILRFDQDEIMAEVDSGRVLKGQNSDGIFFEISDGFSLDNAGNTRIEKMKARLKIQLKPTIVCKHPYTNVGGQLVEDIFPPSTSGFYGRLLSGKSNAVFFIHQIESSELFWLAIVESDSSRIYETQIIKPYEAEALSLNEDNQIINSWYSQSIKNQSNMRKEILSILDEPSQSRKELSKILDNVYIPNLEIGNTIRDTYNQIVPSSFPEEIRDELMTFLTYVVQNKFPDEDPLSYFFKFSSMIVLEDLLSNHLMHVLDGTDFPPYVKLMILAEREQLQAPKRAVSDVVMNSPWLLYSQKCAEMRPNWLDISLDSVRELTKSKRIVVGLPTTKSEAKRSKQSWKKRFAEISYGLLLRGVIDPATLSLVELVYLGAAYRWPHRHMKFISRLGGISENAPHLQVMLMPSSSTERVKRVLPGILHVKWSKRISNYRLYDSKSKQWKVPIDQIIDSIDTKSSIKKLTKEYDGLKIPEPYMISKDDAKVADLVAEGIASFYLESPGFLKNLDLDNRLVSKTITKLVERKIMEVSYAVSDPSLVSLAIIVQGESGSVTALASSFLKYAPTSSVRLNEMSDNGIILSRLPEESIYDIANQLTTRGLENELNVRCMRPTTFRRYTSNLYQRLLREDGTWDDDVSAFLSQARSRRKEMSESNA